MRFDVLTLFPELVHHALGLGVVARAFERNIAQLQCWNPRDYTEDVHRSVDDRPYGGGPGMVMLIEPLRRALASAKALAPRSRVLLMSPQGRPLQQAMLRDWSAGPGLILVCGRYEGIDQRFVDSYVDEEISLGDFVLSGGEIPALAIIDAVARLLPGVLHSAASAAEDSFSDGLLDCPHYTRPEHSPEGAVPEVLLSGNHSAIARWRRQQALGLTWLRRPELLAPLQLDAADRELLDAFKLQHKRGIGVQ